MKILSMLVAVLLTTLLVLAGSQVLLQAFQYLVENRLLFVGRILVILALATVAMAVLGTVDHLVRQIKNDSSSAIGPLTVRAKPTFWFILLLSNWLANLLPGARSGLISKLAELSPESIDSMLPSILQVLLEYTVALSGSSITFAICEAVRLGVSGRMVWELLTVAAYARVNWQRQGRSALTFYVCVVVTTLCLFLLIGFVKTLSI